MATSTVLLLFLLTLLSTSATASASTLLTAAATLSNSGYLSMSLVLQLAAASGLTIPSPTATVFAPTDSAFSRSAPPSLPLLQYHILPRRLSLKTLTFLRRGSALPTLLPNASLTVTASPAFDGFSALNNIPIDGNSVIDDGNIIIYGLDHFFNTSFFEPIRVGSPGPSPNPAPIPTPILPELHWAPGHESFGSAAELLRSKGCSIMAAFLDAQLIGFNRKTRLTVLAPVDGAIEDYMRNATDYSVIFRQHVLNRLLPWQEMVDLEDGSVLSTFQDGFSVNVVKMGDEPVLNDVPVALQDLYVSRFLVVHGLNRLLTPQQQQMVYQEEEPLGYHDDDDEAGNASSFTDWHVTSVADQVTPHFQLDDYH